MQMLKEIVEQIPSISSHEHIGSIASVGMEGDFGFLCDMTPGREAAETTLFDLILSPYFGGLLAASGFCNPYPGIPFGKLERYQQQQLWDNLVPFLKACEGTGLYMALDIALEELYKTSLDSLVEGSGCWQEVSGSIAVQYRQGMYRWSGQAFEKAGLQRALKPVHLSYIAGMDKASGDPAWEEEKKWFTPVYRVDNLLGNPAADGGCDWSHAEKVTGVTIKGIEDLHLMVDRAFELLKKQGIKGIKQLQAYMRTLEFRTVDRADAAAGLEKVLERDVSGRLTVQDYIMERILEKAGRLKLPYQIHTGMANLPHSNPALLTAAIQRHPDVNFVLLHCYPYLGEAAYLARTYRNVYLDAAWLVLQSPGTLHRTLHQWLGFVPYTKICLSTDATSVEECYGAMRMTRRVLARVLEEKVEANEMKPATAVAAAKALLYDNTVQLYGLGD